MLLLFAAIIVLQHNDANSQRIADWQSNCQMDAAYNEIVWLRCVCMCVWVCVSKHQLQKICASIEMQVVGFLLFSYKI